MLVIERGPGWAQLRVEVAALEDAPGVQVEADPLGYPMAQDAAGIDAVLVGRVRVDDSVAHGLNLWVVADNLRKGAATNSVQIAEALLEAGKL